MILTLMTVGNHQKMRIWIYNYYEVKFYNKQKTTKFKFCVYQLCEIYILKFFINWVSLTWGWNYFIINEFTLMWFPTKVYDRKKHSQIFHQNFIPLIIYFQFLKNFLNQWSFLKVFLRVLLKFGLSIFNFKVAAKEFYSFLC